MMERCCDDIAVHAHGGQLYRHGRPYHYRHAFQWKRPKLTVYRAADRRRFRAGLNRYPGVVIGAGVQFGRRVFSLTWGRPGRTIEVSDGH